MTTPVRASVSSVRDPRGLPLNGRARQAGGQVVFIAAWLALAAYAVHPALPANALRLPGADVIKTRVWLPEGWAFFTRDPREVDPLVFQLRDGSWSQLKLGPASRPAYILGLRRYPRALNIELGLIMVAVPSRAWVKCTVLPRECLAKMGAVVSAKNPTPQASLCGSIAIVRQPPVPWAWSRSKVIMPSSVVSVDVRC